jgi:hypothetical protein
VQLRSAAEHPHEIPQTPQRSRRRADHGRRHPFLDGTSARVDRRRPQEASERRFRETPEGFLFLTAGSSALPSIRCAFPTGEAASQGRRGRRNTQGTQAYEPPRKGNALIGVEIPRAGWVR